LSGILGFKLWRGERFLEGALVSSIWVMWWFGAQREGREGVASEALNGGEGGVFLGGTSGP
jgi:hypothetical protein